ncbi:hypothetical protein [Bathymodiolus platifrons methanotrophic gill symbiont]|uniref:hypothetical protein n=1 Tax=Bathymodiolus platifrons methanotrophic gill symbiont TaxID=113268 RepID=UPI001C8DACE2|nr:hypothetical protein [Bathymodiolus platifrons methanotrophic gill symbiont]
MTYFGNLCYDFFKNKIVTKIKDTILPEEVDAIGTLSLRRCAGTHQVTWDKCVYKLGGKGPKGGIVFKIGDHGEHGSEVGSVAKVYCAHKNRP